MHSVGMTVSEYYRSLYTQFGGVVQRAYNQILEKDEMAPGGVSTLWWLKEFDLIAFM